MNSLIRLAALAWVFVAGCTVGLDYRPPEPKLPARWLEIHSAQFDTQPAALVDWWTEFNDAKLNSLIERAVKANLDLALAQARIREARAQLGVSESGGWPTVNLSGSYSRSRTSENSFITGGSSAASSNNLEHDLFKSGFDAAWEIDVFGGIQRRVEASRAGVDAALEERRDVLVTLLGDVARNYIELRGRQRQSAVSLANLKAQQETWRLTKIRFHAGLASDLEVAQAEAQAQTSAAQIPLLESALKQSAYRLDLLLGSEPGRVWDEVSAQAPIPALPPQAKVGLPAELLRRRPDIRRAERQLAAATAQVGAASADLYPKFSLIGSFGLQSVSASDWFTGASRFWSIGPTISWPLFDAGKIRANIEIRSAQQEQALRVYEKTVLTSLSEVESALVSYSKEQSRYRALLEAVSANQRALRSAEDLYRHGLVAFLNVLDAQRNVFVTENELAQSEAAMAVNLVGLYKALGGGWQSD